MTDPAHLFPLPPLAPCPPPGSAPRVALAHAADQWGPGLSGLTADPDEPFVRPCDPLPLESPAWLAISDNAAGLLGLSAAQLKSSPEWLAILSGSAAPAHLQPHAAVYAGHQFGNFVPRLGDGRALNLGSVNGWELQLKGAGPTPFSRFADGRAVLRSSIREFLASEAMHALGIPTTRALCILTSPTPVMRETMETAAVVCRMAPNFVRFGSFEYFAARHRPDLIARLAANVAPSLGIPAQHDPSNTQLGVQLVEEAAVRTARLMAQWMGVGFMHGVMNTDNFSILGLTLDYGPYGFMDAFDAGHICNHTDAMGRYSYQAQPQVGLWNVVKLATAMNVWVDQPQAFEGAVSRYKDEFEKTMQGILRAKLGLQELSSAAWEPLLDDFYRLLQAQQLDYTLAFRALGNPSDQGFLDLCLDREAGAGWLARYRAAQAECLFAAGETQSLRHERMNRVNPKYVLRNWIAEEVIRAVRESQDTQPFNDVLALLERPFDDHPGFERYAKIPPEWAQSLSVSCSS